MKQKDNFVGRVNVKGSVTIPLNLRHHLKLEQGDLLSLTIGKVVHADEIESQARSSESKTNRESGGNDKMSETKFPQSLAKRFEQDGQDIDNETTPIYISRIADVYMKDPTDRWIKRMVADFPESRNVGYGIGGEEEYDMDVYDTDLIEEWFDRWLSQFKENSHDSEGETTQ